MGDMWSPNTAPPSVADTVSIAIVPLPPRMVTAIGTRTPKVPQLVPVANAIPPARMKKIAGKRNCGKLLFARLVSTNACASRYPPFAPMIPDIDHANVRMRIAGTIALNPSVKLDVISLKETTRAII